MHFTLYRMFAFLLAIADGMHPFNCVAGSSYMYMDIRGTITCFTLPATGVWSAKRPPSTALILSVGSEEILVTSRAAFHHIDDLS